MRDLAMPHVRFYVNMEYAPDPQGVPISDPDVGMPDTSVSGDQEQPLDHQGVQRCAFDKTGVDKVEFMLSPNPGEPFKPLAKIASGGESARLLLALKSILSRVDEVPTLVFDEVDVGVGGRAGQVVGEKLWAISAQHQVICITHLPQVAAFGDTHYTITKIFSANRTRTTMQRLDDEQRADEIAAMLDGTPISEHSRRSAQEMLQRAHAQKSKGAQEVQQPLLVQ